MAYTPTVWANGDVITAEQLNKAENGIAAASVAELPSVAAADKGKVLTVDSSGDWDAANLPKEILVLEGDLVADISLNATFTLTHGSMANADKYDFIIIKIHSYLDMGGDTPVNQYETVFVPLDAIWYANTEPHDIEHYYFTKLMYLMSTAYYVCSLQYVVASGTWTATFAPVAS